ncbi:MAG: oxidoreductase [Flavobacteriaceae bacterium]|nr:oxidoreductase [Flavobacteriaceae bacterium]|tara:strand:+ start:3983 stop:4648 length:666 start_codon:yes stop_codon:yes gene_type:complete
MIDKKKIPCIAGSSGLVGSFLIENLSKLYPKIVSISRREIKFSQNNIFNTIVDFDNLENENILKKIDHLYIALGTTRKKAGSAKNFEKVDYHYCINLAKIAFDNGIKRISIVSSVGSNSNSNLLYPRTKGKLEEELAKLPFDHVSIMKPGIILGNRKESRIGEKIAKYIFSFISPLLFGVLAKYKSIHANDISKAMIYQVSIGKNGFFQLEYEKIMKFSKK